MINKKGICYWITGLSGSGKSTLSRNLADLIRKEYKNVVLLDGDNLRVILDSQSFTNKDRLNLSYKYSQTAKMLLDQGIHVIIAVMALFNEVQLWNRKNILNYVEVFLDVPMNELERRDPKGLYLKYKQGLIKNMVGLDLKAEFPQKPDFHFKWDNEQNLKHSCDSLFYDFLKRNKK
tara:strand:- start:689 stop:1219 length:531 start_codon:yes stop_codon:yes gene_type:complete